jgi:hypothetical protein
VVLSGGQGVHEIAPYLSMIQTDMRDQLTEILRVLARAPSADNSQPWRFIFDGEEVHCVCRSSVQPFDPFGPMGHATLLSAGAMHQSMAELFGANCQPEEDIDDDTGRWAINAGCHGIPILHNHVATALMGRHTNRFPYRRSPVDWHASAQVWPQGGMAILVTDTLAGAAVGKTVQTCSAARFNCRELHEWLFASLRWSDEEVKCGDGLDVATLHLPPGGRQLMRLIAPWHRMEWANKVGLYKVMAAVDASLVREAPGVVAIVGSGGTRGAWEAGRLMLSCWVDLNQAGYAVHPYYVVSDIANRLVSGRLDMRWQKPASRALSELREVLGIQVDQRIHMLLRIGRPTVGVVRSARIPIERLTEAPK